MRALKFVTDHVIYNPACTYKLHLKTTQVNRWCRLSAANRPLHLAKQARHPSLLNVVPPSATSKTVEGLGTIQ